MHRFVPAIVILMAATVLTLAKPEAQQGPHWGKNYFPNLPVVTQDGKTVRFYDDLIKGKVVVVSFIYTSCTDFCPLTTARMAQLQERLGDVIGREIFFYSITVDPENDTPQKLKEYASAFQAGPGWSFITGKPEDVRSILFKLGERRRKLTDHRNDVVIGNDMTGEWSKDSLFGDIERLVITIRSMDPKWRDQVRPQQPVEAGNTGLQLSQQPGQALFKKICVPCHTIGVGDRVGPDLYDITARRERAWISSYIRSPDRMRAKKDPVALALAAKYKSVRMPSLGVTADDASDLIAYLEAETSRQKASQGAAGAHHHHGDANHHKH